MTEKFDLLKVGADKRSYLLTVSHYVHQSIEGKEVETYSYSITDTKDVGEPVALVEGVWSGALDASSMNEAKKKAMVLFSSFLSKPEPLNSVYVSSSAVEYKVNYHDHIKLIPEGITTSAILAGPVFFTFTRGGQPTTLTETERRVIKDSFILSTQGYVGSRYFRDTEEALLRIFRRVLARASESFHFEVKEFDTEDQCFVVET
jgi:hypothetical protein